MKYLSLFSGIGGFELGIQQAYEIYNLGRTASTSDTSDRRHQSMSNNSNGDGWRSDTSIPQCVGFSEIDKYAVSIYQKHFPEHKNYGDITKINEKELPDFDLLCGGFPCQSFSIAGKRGGFNDTRGTMFFEIARILKAKQPRLLLLENVKGLLSHEEGRTFATIISTLDELGYDLQWQVLNSKNFGVPQNRERVFIIGHLRGTPRPQVFPITKDGGEFNETPSKLSREIQAEDTANCLTARYWKMAPTDTFIAKTVRSGGRASPHGAKQNWDSYEFDGKIRRLTPKECERLQGFPDGWTDGISDTQRYKTLGNAVTVNVIREIVRRLL